MSYSMVNGCGNKYTLPQGIGCQCKWQGFYLHFVTIKEFGLVEIVLSKLANSTMLLII